MNRQEKKLNKWCGSVAAVMMGAVLLITSADVTPLAALHEDHGNQWNHMWIKGGEEITCKMHGEEEASGQHPCDDAEGSHFVSEDPQCVTQAHSLAFGTGLIEDYPTLHEEDTGCPGGGGET